jgi:hypothetical protein
MITRKKSVGEARIGSLVNMAKSHPIMRSGGKGMKMKRLFKRRPIRPFSNGSQFSDWMHYNCDGCKKDHNRVFHCEIQRAIYFGYGDVSRKIAKRMGYFGHELSYSWRCQEWQRREKDE